MSILTIQPSDIDTYLYYLNPDNNYGTVAYITVDNGSDELQHTVLKFDFSALSAGATISAATLSLYGFGALPEGRTYWAYELTQTGWVETQATWNIYKTGSNWATPGGDYTTTSGASLYVPAGPAWMNWNVLALVQHFQSNHNKIAHFLLRDGAETGGPAIGYFRSNNYTTDLTLRPKLVVTYTSAGLSLLLSDFLGGDCGRMGGMR